MFLEAFISAFSECPQEVHTNLLCKKPFLLLAILRLTLANLTFALSLLRRDDLLLLFIWIQTNFLSL